MHDAPFTLRASRPQDGARVVAVWAAAVDATHTFLAPHDRIAIGEEVATFLPQASLVVACRAGAEAHPSASDAESVVGFLLMDGAHVEALFVDPAVHGRGVGRALMAHAIAAGAHSVDVNEANKGALAFYTHLGFVEVGRAAVDGQGRPYPLLHLRLAK